MIFHIGYPKAGSTFIQDEILSRVEHTHIISNESLGFDWVIESPQEVCAVKAKNLSENHHPDSRIILVTRHPGEWLESWWRHQTRGLSRLGCIPLHKAIKTEFFSRQIAPHLYPLNVEREFRKYFKDVIVIPFSLLQDAPLQFVRMFCKYAEIEIPPGINYRKANFSRSHIWYWFQMVINAAWVRWGPRRYDNKYLYIMKHWVSRIDGLKRKLRGLRS